MCGRYDLMDEKHSGKMHAFIEMCNRTALPEEKIDETDFGEICPGDLAPGMICADGMIHAVSMRWGFVEKDRKLVINARCESVLERAMFRHLAESHRCAMPAAAYFEWRRGDGQKYRIMSETQQTIYLAGLYRLNSVGKREFVILTKPSFGICSGIHHRMPVTFQTRDEARRWLRSDTSVADILASSDEMLYATTDGTEQMTMIFDD